MSQQALQACVDRHLAHAAMVFVLDEELGMRHGLSWTDFVLLTVLDAAGGAAPATELARTLRTPASRLLQCALKQSLHVLREDDSDYESVLSLRASSPVASATWISHTSKPACP